LAKARDGVKKQGLRRCFAMTDMMFHAQNYDAQRHGSEDSAAMVVPLIMSLFPGTKSVIDVGCGVGAWLSAFSANGVPHIRGLEGGQPAPHQLKIPASAIQAADLSNPPEITERYDLALSLEVAEHLPQSSARSFVAYLCGLSDHVVFSAAVPEQGGVNHINEQPLSYWRDLFAEQGYTLYDCLRPRIWNDTRIKVWYRQNMVVAISGKVASGNLRPMSPEDLIDVVHPELFQRARRKARRKKKGTFLRRIAAKLRAAP
jgi:Methyltransferase domain